MTVPTVSIQKNMDVSGLISVRQHLRVRPSWSSILAKAYAKVVASRPDLRRAYLTIPWERMYEYHKAVADVVIEARLEDEDVLVTVPLEDPDTRPLLDIDAKLAACKEKPIERVRVFRHALYLARFPPFLRRFLMR